MKQSLETAWQEKMTCLPGEVMHRLELEPLYARDNKVTRYLINGLSAEAMRTIIQQKIPETVRGKIFTDVPLDTFPKETLELVILLWSLSAEMPQETLKQVYRVLKTYGQCVLVTTFDGSPKVPWSILKNVLVLQRRQQERPLQIYKSGLPQNTRQLRKIMDKTGFKDIRVWEDGVSHQYQDGGLLFDDLIRLSTNDIFHDSVTPELKTAFRQKFCELFKKMVDVPVKKVTNKSTSGIEVIYSFAGTIGVK